jgi:hypothetical protein
MSNIILVELLDIIFIRHVNRHGYCSEQHLSAPCNF